MTQDHVLVVVRCKPEGHLEVPVIVGNVHVPYDSAKGLESVARTATDGTLFEYKPPPECTIIEASYWTRDEDGGGDYVLQIPVAPGTSTSVWWVPDEGDPQRSSLDAIPTRVFVDRLLRVASYFSEVEERTDKAVQLLATALSLDPENARLAEVRAELVMEIDPGMAVSDLRSYLVDHEASDDLQATLAMALISEGSSKATLEADRILDSILVRTPMHLKALSARAERLREQGKKRGALEAYRDLIHAHPDAVETRYGLATLLLEMRKRDEALEHLDAYLSTYKDDQDALFLRARLRLSRGDKEGAAQDIEALKRIAPTDPQVQKLAAKIRR